MDSKFKNHKRGGFSLIELVIVVVIIGIIGAIAIPRLSRGAEGASDSALKGDLAVLRGAIDLYATEHGGVYPTLANIEQQLTQYTNADGTSWQTTKDTTHTYGPYMRKIPALKVGARKNSDGFGTADGVGIGWIYDASTGAVTANTSGTEMDASGTLYSDY